MKRSTRSCIQVAHITLAGKCSIWSRDRCIFFCQTGKNVTIARLNNARETCVYRQAGAQLSQTSEKYRGISKQKLPSIELGPTPAEKIKKKIKNFATPTPLGANLRNPLPTTPLPISTILPSFERFQGLINQASPMTARGGRLLHHARPL